MTIEQMAHFISHGSIKKSLLWEAKRMQRLQGLLMLNGWKIGDSSSGVGYNMCEGVEAEIS